MTKLWPQINRRLPGGKVPDTYVVFDTETSGLKTNEIGILQMGLVFVVQGQVVERMSVLVKRPQGFKIDPRAEEVHHISWAKLDQDGLPPEVIFPLVVEQLESWRKDGAVFVGHNLMNFDAPFLEYETTILGCPFRFRDNEVVDTGMLVKAAQLDMFFRNEQESLRSFYKRVSEVRRSGLYWSLDRYCFDAYNLQKYGIKRCDAHDAGVDCELTHYLLNELKVQQD